MTMKTEIQKLVEVDEGKLIESMDEFKSFKSKIYKKTMTKKIIGIGNKARQGKDEVAKILNRLIPNSIILHFADELYEECYNKDSLHPLIFKVSDGFMCKYDNDKNYYFLNNHLENENVSSAYNKLIDYDLVKGDYLEGMVGKDPLLLQWWGTDYRRNLFSDRYWVNKTDEKINSCKEEVIIIPDTRFFNEYNYIKENDGIYINVKRYDSDGISVLATDRDNSHISECELDNVKHDILIINNSTLADLEEKTINLIKDFIL